jgi:hypothetical protein
MLIRKLYRANGEEIRIMSMHSICELAEMLDTDDIDLEYLVDGIHVMLVDKHAKTKDLKINTKATDIYRKGFNNSFHAVLGDAIVVPLEDLNLCTP